MRRGIFGLAIIGAVLLTGLLLSLTGRSIIAKAEDVPPIIINEVAWAGSSMSSLDEWIELKNTTSTDINLAGWQLTKDTSGNGSAEGLMIRIADNPTDPTSTTVSAGGYFLISNNGPEYDFGAGKLSVLNVAPDYIDSAMTLSNSNLSIKLYNGTWNSGGGLIDTAGDGKAPLAGSNTTKTSMERNGTYGLGDLKSSWHEANTAINLDAGVIDKATPRSSNSEPPKLGPSIVTINPTSATIDAVLEMEAIEGNNFSTTGTTRIQLRNTSQSISASEVHVATPVLIDSAKFNLAGATAGNWDIVVINPDGQEGILPNALELTEPEEENDGADYSMNIIINEVYPKPSTSSNDEFIELYNTGEASINLRGWQLDDQSPGGSAPYTITENQIVAPHDYAVFTKAVTHISLNDNGDSARLVQPNGNVISQLTYDTAKAGYAYAWINDRWQWTMRVTKGAKNILELPEADTIDDNDEAILGEQDRSENPWQIDLELSTDQIGSTSVMLQWQLDNLGYIDEVKIYQSITADQLGELLMVASARKLECEVTGLKPNTKYFFTAQGDYNAYTATSNQVEVTTKKSAAYNPAQSINQPTGQLIITELLPNPGGGDSEWIEIYNPTDQPIVITGWKLMDKSKRRYVFSVLDLAPIDAQATDEEEATDELIIEPEQYLTLDQDTTNIHLNNSGGEEVYLLDSDDNIVDMVTYTGTAKRDYAYALAPNEKWFWTEEATPGQANEISFAGEMDDSGNYLTPSGAPKWWQLAGWLSGLLSAIMLLRIIQRNVKAHHQN